MPGWLTFVLWVAAFLWICSEIVAFRNMGSPLMVRIYMCTGALFAAVFLRGIGYGWQSLISGTPFAAGWLGLKVLLCGLIFLVSSLLAVFYAP